MWFLKIFLLLITQYEKVKLDVVSDIINRKYEIRLEHEFLPYRSIKSNSSIHCPPRFSWDSPQQDFLHHLDTRVTTYENSVPTLFYYAYIWRARGEGRRRRIEDDVGSRVGPRFRWRRRRKRVDEAGGRDRRSRAAVPLQQPPPPPLPPTPVPRVQLSQTFHAPDAKGDICLDRARQRPPPPPISPRRGVVSVELEAEDRVREVVFPRRLCRPSIRRILGR